MAGTMLGTMRDITRSCLDAYDGTKKPEEIAKDILAKIRQSFEVHNESADKLEKWRIPSRLLPIQMTEILMTVYHIVGVNTRGSGYGESYALMAVYQEDGANKGIYVSSTEMFHNLVNQFGYKVSKNYFHEVMLFLRLHAPLVEPCMEPNLVAMNNGIYDKDADRLMPFTPDLVFLEKSDEDYNPNSDAKSCE